MTPMPSVPCALILDRAQTGRMERGGFDPVGGRGAGNGCQGDDGAFPNATLETDQALASLGRRAERK